MGSEMCIRDRRTGGESGCCRGHTLGPAQGGRLSARLWPQWACSGVCAGVLPVPALCPPPGGQLVRVLLVSGVAPSPLGLCGHGVVAADYSVRLFYNRTPTRLESPKIAAYYLPSRQLYGVRSFYNRTPPALLAPTRLVSPKIATYSLFTCRLVSIFGPLSSSWGTH